MYGPVRKIAPCKAKVKRGESHTGSISRDLQSAYSDRVLQLQHTATQSRQDVEMSNKRRRLDELGCPAAPTGRQQFFVVDCAKSAIAKRADLDCEDCSCTEWQQTFKAMRAEAMISGQVAQSYMRCLQSFAEKQADLTLATLSSNTLKGDRVHAQKVRRQYEAAHAFLLGGSKGDKESRSLSVEKLLTAHKLLMHGLCEAPGDYRRIHARCGNRRFVPPCQVPGLMKEMVKALDVVLARRDISMSAKAGWLLGNLLAIHPFNDGNGRLARIVANWVLVSCDLPFSVVLCSSDSQRADYIQVCACACIRMYACLYACMHAYARADYCELCYVSVSSSATVVRMCHVQACKRFHVDGKTLKLATCINAAILRGICLYTAGRQ
jgi:hypothetical protein